MAEAEGMSEEEFKKKFTIDLGGKSSIHEVQEYMNKPKQRRKEFLEIFFADAEEDLPIMKASRQVGFIVAFYKLAMKPGQFVVKQLFQENQQLFIDQTWKMLKGKLDPVDIVRVRKEQIAKAEAAIAAKKAAEEAKAKESQPVV
jgi:small ligand-binding sensory domain FIST